MKRFVLICFCFTLLSNESISQTDLNKIDDQKHNHEFGAKDELVISKQITKPSTHNEHIFGPKDEIVIYTTVKDSKSPSKRKEHVFGMNDEHVSPKNKSVDDKMKN